MKASSQTMFALSKELGAADVSQGYGAAGQLPRHLVNAQDDRNLFSKCRVADFVSG